MLFAANVGGMEKIMTESNKKRRFNTVDTLIVLLILAVVAAGGIFLKMTAQKNGGADSFEVEYVIEFRTVRDEFTDNIEVGTQIVDSAKKYRLGEVIGVSSTPAKYTGVDLNSGELVYYDYPEHSDMSVTIRTTAVLDDDGMYIIDNGYRMSVGTTVYVRTPNYVGTGYCTKFKKMEIK